MSAVLETPASAPGDRCPHYGVTLLVDLFAGGGGTSTGAIRILNELGLVIGKNARVIAINHDEKALATHKRNHPEAEHWEDDIEKRDPRDVIRCPDCGDLIQMDEFVGSPPCPDFSNAAGGKPKNRQRRATVYYILKWIRWGRPKRGTFENVPEFLKTPEYRKFKRGILALRKIGLRYRVEEKVLNAADYGGAQSRKRAFIKIAIDDEPIVWPVQTHSKGGKVPGTKPWVGAITVLNLTEPTRSIFGRKTKTGLPQPLSLKTRRRIARGIRAKGRFWEPLASAVETDAGPVPMRRLLEAAPPDEWPSSLRVALTLGQQGGAEARDVSEPVATIASAGYVRLAEARFLLPVDGIHGNGTTNPPRDVDEPMATVRAERGGGHLVEPMLFHVTHGTRAHDPGAPLPTVTGANRGELAIADAFIVNSGGPEMRRERGVEEPLPTLLTYERLAVADARLIISLDRPETNRSTAKDPSEPLPTQTAHERVAVVEPFLLSNVGRAAEHPPREAAEPLPTILTRDGTHVLEPFFVPHHGEREGQLPRYHDANAPLPTLPASRALDVVLMRLVQTYNENGGVRDATDPLSTETAVQRHALLEVRVDHLLADVGMRMLTVRELARGQGFPDSYVFLGNKGDQVRQVGNAVHVDIAYHLIAADFSGLGYRDTRLSDFGGAAA